VRRPIAFAAVAGALLLGSLANAPASNAGPQVASAPVSSDEQSLVAWHNALVDAINGSPDLFAGIRKDAKSGGYVVLTNPGITSEQASAVIGSATSAALSQVTSSATSAAWSPPPVTTEVSASSAAATAKAQDAVTAAKSANSPETAHVLQWGPDSLTGSLVIGLDHEPTAADRETLSAKFGAGIQLTYAQQSSTTSRAADSPSWYGGDRMISNAGNGCTSGFSVKSGAYYYDLSAGHCGSHSWAVGSTTIGSTAQLIWPQNGLDTQRIHATTVAGRIWNGSLTASTSVPVKGSWSAATGDSLCFSGAYSFWQCSAIVTTNNQCVYFANDAHTSCHLWLGTSQNGSILSRAGDSGGPVAHMSGTNAYATGTIVGSYGDGTSAWMQLMGDVLPALGVSLVTG